MRFFGLYFAGAIASFATAGAAMAADTRVNVADPTVTSRVARVEAGNRLAVQEVPPSTFFHAFKAVNPASACAVLALPPSGKALVVQQIRVGAIDGPSNGNPYLQFYADTSCTFSQLIGEVNPTAVGGPILMPLTPGVAIPASGGMSVRNSTGFGADIYVDGYTVIPGVAPLAGQTIQVNGRVPGGR